MSYATQTRRGTERNRLYSADRPVHAWYRFPLSFPPHLVRQYLERFNLTSQSQVLDPFCGTGTTLVECKKQGIPSTGIEANAVVHFAACTKTDWSVSPTGLEAQAVADSAQQILAAEGWDAACLSSGCRSASDAGNPRVLRRLTAEQTRLLIAQSISPLPLHRALVLRDQIQQRTRTQYRAHAHLAYAKQLVSAISNLRFGPEVGIGKIKDDAPVVDLWLSAMRTMASDLQCMQSTAANRMRTPTAVHCADARQPEAVLAPRSIDAVITSPPYPNEKDYSRTTRLESVLLDFLHDRPTLRAQKLRFCAPIPAMYIERITMTNGLSTIRGSRPSPMPLRPVAKNWARHPGLKNSTPAWSGSTSAAWRGIWLALDPRCVPARS